MDEPTQTTFTDMFKNSFLNMFPETVDPWQLVTVLAVSLLLGLCIYAVYRRCFMGVVYDHSFAISLVIMTVLVSVIIVTISSNVMLSLGMVGALSIVRFRTAIKDARDTTYIFWAIICGICCGVAQFLAAAVGSVCVFVLMVLLGRIRNDVRTLVIIRAARVQELAIEGKMYEAFSSKASLRVKNTTEESVEFIYEVSKGVLDRAQKTLGTSLTEKIYALGAVEYVNIVSQNDEIGS